MRGLCHVPSQVVACGATFLRQVVSHSVGEISEVTWSGHAVRQNLPGQVRLDFLGIKHLRQMGERRVVWESPDDGVNLRDMGREGFQTVAGAVGVG